MGRNANGSIHKEMDNGGESVTKQQLNSKRARVEKPLVIINARLLANNKYASLPIQQIAVTMKLPPLFTATKDISFLQAEMACDQLIYPLRCFSSAARLAPPRWNTMQFP